MVFEGGTVGVLVLALNVWSGRDPTELLQALPGPTEAVAGLFASQGRERTFLALIALAVVAQLAVSLLAFCSRVAAARLQAKVEGDLKNRVFQRLVSVNYAQVMRFKVGELASYNDQVNYVGHVIQLLNVIAGHSFLVVAYAIAMVFLSWQMSLIALAVMLVLAKPFQRILVRIRAMGKKFTEASVALSARTVEFLSGLRIVHTFGRERFAIERVGAAIQDSVKYRLRGLTWHAVIGPLTDALTVLAVAGFLVGGYVVMGGAATGAMPRILAFLYALYRLVPKAKAVNVRVGYISNHWQFVRNVAAILEDKELEARPRGGTAIRAFAEGIEFRDVGLSYEDGERPALSELSFTLPKGKVLGLVGESGSGKSSVADLLLGLYRPTSGEIFVDGVAAGELDWSSWRKHIGVVTQDAFIFHASVRENIAFGRLAAPDDAIEEAARAADAHDFILGLADGYDSIVGDQGYRLSAGQRQRIALARTILRDPDVLVLDEATSHLDSRSERAVHEALERIKGERTMLVVAHRLSTLTTADEILVLEAGRLVERGTHQELLASGGVYAKLWALQTGSTQS